MKVADILRPLGRDVTHISLDVIGNPFHKVGAILILDAQHLLVHLLHGHSAAEDGSNSQLSAVPWIAGCHHVLIIEHLLRQLRHREGPVLLAASRSQGGKTRHEKVKPSENVNKSDN